MLYAAFGLGFCGAGLGVHRSAGAPLARAAGCPANGGFPVPCRHRHPHTGGHTGAAGAYHPLPAVWVSYLEWQQLDFSSADAFSRGIDALLDNIDALGATVVLAQVRPFGDALYPSTLFPFSHLCTGVQGQDPGFDPLALLVEAAHARGLELEAWINPYRLQAGSVPVLCDESPAVQHPDWTKATDTGLYLDPANPDVRQYIADGIRELCQNYPLDGIHLDDYFYPTTSATFDAAEYAAAGTGLSLADWRRQKRQRAAGPLPPGHPKLRRAAGGGPLADLSLCRDGQYSDAALWLAEGGYADYLMPQLYWGQSYTLDGDDAHSLGKLAAQWAALPRAPEVALYGGLGAYRIGDGDGSDGGAAEWQTGHALAYTYIYLESLGFTGAGLYRYASLWENPAWPDLAAAERQALADRWVTASPGY